MNQLSSCECGRVCSACGCLCTEVVTCPPQPKFGLSWDEGTTSHGIRFRYLGLQGWNGKSSVLMSDESLIIVRIKLDSGFPDGSLQVAHGYQRHRSSLSAPRCDCYLFYFLFISLVLSLSSGSLVLGSRLGREPRNDPLGYQNGAQTGALLETISRSFRPHSSSTS